MSGAYDELGWVNNPTAPPEPEAPVAAPARARNTFEDIPAFGPKAEPPDLARPALFERAGEHFGTMAGQISSAVFDLAYSQLGSEQGIAERRERRIAEKNIFAAMPAAEGFTENAAAIVGGLGGAVMDPFNFAPVPGIAAASRLGSGGQRIGALAGIGGAFGAGAEGLSQAGDVAIGARPGFSAEHIGMAGLVGAGLFGTIGGVVEGAQAIKGLNARKLDADAARVAEMARRQADTRATVPADPVAPVPPAAAVPEPVAQPVTPAVDVPLPKAAEPKPIVGRVESDVPAMPVHKVATPDGQSVDVAPRVVEASQLVTSADDGYDAVLQPRNRDRAASQVQIREIAGSLQPERLGLSSEADRGAPIVGSDMIVESGNGRVMAIREAYRQNGEQAERYREWVAAQGVDVTGFREPVIVRERLTDLTPDERQAFTVNGNRAATLAMSSTERAMADTAVLTPDLMGLIRNADKLEAADNRQFITSFIAKLPQTEQGAMVAKDGAVSAEGIARVRNALLARAYDDERVIARVTEAMDDEIRSVSAGLTAAAPEWARMRAAAAEGLIPPEFDQTKTLVEAVLKVAEIRGKGQKLHEYIDQLDAFDQLKGETERFLRMFYAPSGNRAAGKDRIADALRFYAEEARKQSADTGLDLGGGRVVPSDIQNAAIAKQARRNAAEQEAGLFGNDLRESGQARGGETQRPGAGEGSGASGSPRGSARLAGASPEASEPRFVTSSPDGSWSIPDDIGRAPEGTANLGATNQPTGTAFAKPKPTGPAQTVAQPIDKGQAFVHRRELPGELRADVNGKDPVTVTLAEAMADVSDALDAVTRKGAYNKRALGQANMDQSVIRLRSKGDFVVFMHEAGHIADRTLFDASPAFQAMRAGHAAELALLDANNPAGQQTVLEGFAEFMRMYGINRPYAEQQAPNFFAEFDPWFRANHADIAAAFDIAHDAYQQFIRSAPAEMAKTIITSNADLAGLRGVWAETEGLPISDRLFATARYYANVAYGKLVNEWRPIGLVQDRLEALARANGVARQGPLKVSEDAGKLAQMLNGHDVAGIADMRYGVRQANGTIAEGPTLGDVIATAFNGKRVHRESAEYQDFGAYLVSKRAEHLYAMFEQGRIKQPPVGDSWQRVSAAVADLEVRYPQFRQASELIYEINNLLLKKEHEAGLLSAADYAKVQQESRFYVPFFRAEEKVQNLKAGQSIDRLRQLTQRYGGDPTAKIIDPIEATIQRALLVNRAVRENQIYNALADMANAAGPGSGKYFENFPPGTKEDALVGQPYITRYRGGEKLFSRFGDDAEGRWAFNTIAEMGPGKFDIVTRFLALFSQTLSRSVTAIDPSFFIANLARDQMTVFATQRHTGGAGYLPLASWVDGITNVVRGKVSVDEIERLYAQFGGHRGGAIEEQARHFRDAKSADPFLRMPAPVDPVAFGKDVLTRGWKLWQGVIEMSETGTRFGLFKNVYKQALKEGLSEYEAALRASYEARDIMDFSRKGAGMAVWRSFAPFINPNIQGWDRALRGLGGDRAEVAKSMARYAILATSHAGYWAAMHDTEAYQKSADVMRHRYWVFPAPASLMGERAASAYVAVPKPFDLAGLMINLLEEGLNWYATSDPEGAKKLAKALVSPVTDLPIQNPLATAAAGVMANYDFFFKRNIVPPSMTRLPVAMQKFSTTDPWFVKLGTALNVSPLKLQYAARSVTGQTPEKMLDFASDIAGIEAAPGQHVIDNAFLRLIGSRFVRSSDKFSQYQIDMLELMGRDVGKASLAASQFKAMKTSGWDAGMMEVWNKADDVEKSVIAVDASPSVTGSQKLIHPLFRANAIELVLSQMTRDLSAKFYEENKPTRRQKGEQIARTPVSFETADNVINLIRDIRNRETYNALAVIGKAGYDASKITPPDVMAGLYRRIGDHHAGIGEEIERRITATGAPEFERVRESWPDLKLRAMEERDALNVDDLIRSRSRRRR